MEKIENTPAVEAVEACRFTAGCYGNCPACFCADSCPTWQGVSAERAYVFPNGDHTTVVAVR